MLVRPEINGFVFDRAQKTSMGHVVHAPAFAIHAHLGRAFSRVSKRPTW